MLAALAGALAAGAVACESKPLGALGGVGGTIGTIGSMGHPLGHDAGAGGASKPGGDAGAGHPVDALFAPVGASCAGRTDCASGFCVEGICCASACASGCQTCSAPGAVGTCLARAARSAPRQAADCPLDAPTSCGLDGTCDGEGACRAYLGNTCASGVCSNGVVTGVFACDGVGVCRAGVTQLVCAPYACDPVTNLCLLSCQNDSQCSAGLRCQSGACVLSSGSGGCSRNEQCVSGNCADGVCCDTACKGSCVSCAITGHVGTCSPVSAGSRDPHAVCVDQGASTCGPDGTCDGAGACTLYAAGTACAAGSACSGMLWTGAGSCDGAGTCQRQTIPCSPYACDPQTNDCHVFCITADDCAPGKPCVNGSCGNPQPAFCSADAECASGFCAQGACCATRCDGPCSSCALPGTIGTCMPVPNPPDAGACGP